MGPMQRVRWGWILSLVLAAASCDKEESLVPVGLIDAGGADAPGAPVDLAAAEVVIDEGPAVVDQAETAIDQRGAGGEPAFGTFGGPCNLDSDCEGGFCLNDRTPMVTGSFPGGFCSARCQQLADSDAGTSPECPLGFYCGRLALWGTSPGACVQGCFPGVPACSRKGYGCSASLRHCVVGCEDPSDCAAGQSCSPQAGSSGKCFTPTATLGSPCAQEQDCQQDGYCESEAAGWPGGACLQRCGPVAADASSPAGTCPGDGRCLLHERLSLICHDGCNTDADCRAGYGCQDPGGGQAGQRYCAPACTSDAVCTGGRTCDFASGRCR